MLKHLMIAINWYGPYQGIEIARSAAKRDYEDGLYLAIGRRLYERDIAPQYIGIGSSLHTRLTEDHHKLSQLKGTTTIWLGEVLTATPPGKAIKWTPAPLDYSEWLHAHFMCLPLNEKKTKSLPPRSVTVLNRWFKIDYETPYLKRPHSQWPDLIDFQSAELPARAVWFGGKQKIFKPAKLMVAA